MKALSIKQPWLYCITDLPKDAAKRIENRTWKPPAAIIGRQIALHASKGWDSNVGVEAASYRAGVKLSRLALSIPTGVIVATAVVAGWVGDYGAASELRFAPLCQDKWFFGPIGWVLEDVRKLEKPVPVRGSLGLWDWQGDGVGGDT